MKNCNCCTRWRHYIDFLYDIKNLKNNKIRKCDYCHRKYNRKYWHQYTKHKVLVRGPKLDPLPIINLIKSNKMTWKEVSDISDINLRNIYDWRIGKYKISLYNADKLCVALNTNLNLLYDI